MKRVVVGLSGGVDSSVAAYLLKNQGYQVIGLFMKNWHDDSVTISDECPWLDDSHDAMLVAESLGIPFQVVDLSESYKKRIVDYMFREYKLGRTPNPDVLCNREIKFDAFMKIALSLKADYVATGHYCRKEVIENPQGNWQRLLSGVDTSKDQSYFLCQLHQNQLEKALFPIGHLTKAEVRKIALEQNLVTANKKDSQGLCFVGKIKLPDFLKQKLFPKTGDIIQIPSDNDSFYELPKGFSIKEPILEKHSKKHIFSPSDGLKVGVHDGAHFFTVGQRKGLGVGGNSEPLFVLGTDIQNNIIYVGKGKSHPGLYRKTIFIKEENVHWVRTDMPLKNGGTRYVKARIRYRQPLQEAQLVKVSNGLYVDFLTSQSAVAEGQFVAWYVGEELIGSGII